MLTTYQRINLRPRGVPHIPRPARQMVGRQNLAGVFLLKKRYRGFGDGIVIPGNNNRVTLVFQYFLQAFDLRIVGHAVEKVFGNARAGKSRGITTAQRRQLFLQIRDQRLDLGDRGQDFGSGHFDNRLSCCESGTTAGAS